MHTSLDLSEERPDAVVVGVDADGGLERLLGEAVEAEHVVDPPEAVQARHVRRVHAQAVLVARLRHLKLVARLVYLTPAAKSCSIYRVTSHLNSYILLTSVLLVP